MSWVCVIVVYGCMRLLVDLASCGFGCLVNCVWWCCRFALRLVGFGLYLWLLSLCCACWVLYLRYLVVSCLGNVCAWVVLGWFCILCYWCALFVRGCLRFSVCVWWGCGVCCLRFVLLFVGFWCLILVFGLTVV